MIDVDSKQVFCLKMLNTENGRWEWVYQEPDYNHDLEYWEYYNNALEYAKTSPRFKGKVLRVVRVDITLTDFSTINRS